MKYRSVNAIVGTIAILVSTGFLASSRAATAGTSQDIGQYGFRYDPMKWVANDNSLEAAKVRTFVFGKPKKGDQALIDAEVKKSLADQQKDGGFPGKSDSERIDKTAEVILKLVRLGVDTKRPELQKATQFLLGSGIFEKKDPNIRGTAALCLTCPRDNEKVKKLLERATQWVSQKVIGRMCPWAEVLSLRMLFAGEGIIDTQPVITKILQWANRERNSAGAISYKDARAFIVFAGYHDDPLLRKLVVSQIPMILRDQQEDGSFRHDMTFPYLKALHRLGLLEKLRTRPPLPADWKIARKIPVKEDNLSGLTWDGNNFWLYDRKGKRVVKISSKDGKTLKTLTLPFGDIAGLSWGGDCLLLTQDKAKKLHRINPESGKITKTIDLGKMEWIGEPLKVGDEIWITDHFMGCFRRYLPAHPEDLGWRGVAGGIGNEVCFSKNGIWHIDAWTPSMIKSNLHGKLLNWGEKPFKGKCNGLAWDGANLWAFDKDNKQICCIEKARPYEFPSEGYKNAIELKLDSFYQGLRTYDGTKPKLHLSNISPFDVSFKIHSPASSSGKLAAGDMLIEVPAESDKAVVADLVESGSKGDKPVKLAWEAEFKLTKNLTHKIKGALTADILPKVTIRKRADIKDLEAVHNLVKEEPTGVVMSEGKCVGELRTAVAGKYLAVNAKVFDPRCRKDKKEWKECNTDIYVSRPGTETIRQFVFFAESPDGKKKILPHESGIKRSSTDFECRIVPIEPFGYEIDALIPLSEFLLKPDVKQFLMDCAMVVAPSADARGKFCLLFTGNPRRCAFRNNHYYALVEVKK